MPQPFRAGLRLAAGPPGLSVLRLDFTTILWTAVRKRNPLSSFTNLIWTSLTLNAKRPAANDPIAPRRALAPKEEYSLKKTSPSGLGAAKE
jgi:hypothetical protein